MSMISTKRDYYYANVKKYCCYDDCDECPYPDCEPYLVLRWETAFWIAMSCPPGVPLDRIGKEIGLGKRELQRWRAHAVKFGLI